MSIEKNLKLKTEGSSVSDLVTNKKLFTFHGVIAVLRNYGDFYLSFGISISLSCIYAYQVRSMNLNAESKLNLTL